MCARAMAARIKLDRPANDGYVATPLAKGKKKPAKDAPSRGSAEEGWPLPKGVQVNENFWLKVQSNGAGLLCYDEERSVECRVLAGRPGYALVTAKVEQEGVMGGKAHFKAHIDAHGDIFVDISRCHIKGW
jgi:hypothetical protein